MFIRVRKQTSIMDSRNVALFDMDNTLCDYNGQFTRDMERLGPPIEPEFIGSLANAPVEVQRRADSIKSSARWWQSLPKLQLGWDVLGIARDLGYRIVILTGASKRYPEALVGKKLWIDENLGPDVGVIFTREKGLVYGKVLVDDFPKYTESWLTERKKGLVVMPAHWYNEGYSHDQVIKYDGSNREEIGRAMEMRLAEPQELSRLLRGRQDARRRIR